MLQCNLVKSTAIHISLKMHYMVSTQTIPSHMRSEYRLCVPSADTTASTEANWL